MKGATMNIIGWVILFASLFGFLAPLAFEGPPGDGFNHFAMQISTKVMFFTALAPHPLRTSFSRVGGILLFVNPVSGTFAKFSPLNLLNRDESAQTCWATQQLEETMRQMEMEQKGDVCPLSDIKDHLQALLDFDDSFRNYLTDETASPPELNTREYEYHVRRQMRRISAGIDARLKGLDDVDDDHVIVAASRVLAGKLHHRHAVLQKLTEAVNHLSNSNMTLTEQLADLTINLQKNHESTANLKKQYEALHKENAKLRTLFSQDSRPFKRDLDTNSSGSTNSSTNISAPLNNETFADRLAKLEAKSEEPAWKAVPEILFKFIGYTATANTFFVLILDVWIPRTFQLFSLIVGILAGRCCNVKPFQNWLAKTFPTKSDLKELITTLRTDHTSLRTSHDALDAEFKNFTAIAGPNGQAGPFATLHADNIALRGKHDALQVNHDALKDKHDAIQVKHNGLQDKHNALQVKHNGLQDKHDAIQVKHNTLQDKHDALQDKHDALTHDDDGTIPELQLQVKANDKKVMTLERQVATLTQRLEALVQTSPLQAPAGQIGTP